MFALHVSPQQHPLMSRFLLPASAGDSVLNQCSHQDVHLPNQSNLALTAMTFTVPISYFQLLLYSHPLHYFQIKTVSTSGQSSHHVWHEAHPPSQCLQTLWKVMSILTAQGWKNHSPQAQLVLKCRVKLPLASTVLGLVLKVMLNATWRVCIFSMVRDSIMQLEVLKPTNHFNKNCEISSRNIH